MLAAGEIFTNQNWGAITSAIDALAGFADGLVAALNPLETFLPVPQIGPVYGHSTAYLAGNIAGTVAGMVAPMLLTAGASSSLLLTKAMGVMDKVGNVADVAGLVWDVGNTALDIAGGEGGVSDALSFLPGADLFGPDGSDEGECFIAGTAVITSAADATGQFSTKRIEDVRVGDLVLSRSEADTTAPLQLKPVTRLFRNVAYSIQWVTLLLADGGTETLAVTAGHSFWVEGQGWTPAELLLAEQRVLTGDSNNCSRRTPCHGIVRRPAAWTADGLSFHGSWWIVETRRLTNSDRPGKITVHPFSAKEA